MDIIDCRDYFGKKVKNLKEKKLFLFDLDGTIYEENCLFEGVLELLDKIKKRHGQYVFITNNSSKSVNDYILKTNQMGLKTNYDNFFTSAQATVLYIKKNYPGAKVYCQGTKSLIREIADAGIEVTETVEKDVDLVLVGFDTELTSQKLRNTCEILQRDIPFIATNPDLRCPVSFGFIPDCGSICKMIEAATGKKPFYIGKPKPMIIQTVCEKYNCRKEETVVIGDRLYTDIASGINADVMTVAVLTGEATAEEIENGDIKPTYTFHSIKEMCQCL